MKRRLGFTIIEVSLFLAISALLFVGIAAGTGINISRQRYNNAVQDYTEFLRRLYSQTEDTQNGRAGIINKRNNNHCTISSNNTAGFTDYRRQGATGATSTEQGRTNCAVYGKIAVFNAILDGKDDDDPSDNDNITDRGTNKIMVYDVIGDIVDNEHRLPEKKNNNQKMTTIEALFAVHAEFLAVEENNSGTCSVAYSGNMYSYTPDWSAHIETTERGQYWSGAVMIVRSPIDGSIHTYVLDLNGDRSINPSASDSYKRITDLVSVSGGTTHLCQQGNWFSDKARNGHAYLADYLDGSSSTKFSDTETTNFCVNSPDSYVYNGRRRNVRLKPDGSNSAAVELIEMDSGEYNEKTNPGGNACE